jgi:hypothetical protein
MRALASDFFARSPVMAGPVIAIVLFFTVFAGVVIWLLRRKADSFDALAHIALEGEPGPRALASDSPTEEVSHG